MELGNQNKHVLLVDDDLVLALTYQELLEANGFEVSTAGNGKEALKVLAGAKVDAIICDLSMPELSGDVFYREVGIAHPELRKRFVFLTANADNPLYENFLKSISAPVVAKPATIEHVLEKLRPVLAAPEGGNSTRFFRAETPEAGDDSTPGPRWKT
jgi:CheY-like chemotaxis protein